MDVVRLDWRQRETIRDGVIDQLTLAEVLERLRVLAPNDIPDVEYILKDLLRRRWPSDISG